MPKRYFLALILVTILFFGGVFLLIRLVTGGGDDSNKPQETSEVQKNNTLSKDAKKVTYTVYGEVVAEEDRRAIRITITNSERKVEVLKGYDQSIIKSQVLSNKESAFDSFLLALETAKYSTRDTAVKNDEREVCPLGNIYAYEADYDDNSSFRSWYATCDGVKASFRGNRSMVDTLFKAQIPEYNAFVNDVSL